MDRVVILGVHCYRSNRKQESWWRDEEGIVVMEKIKETLNASNVNRQSMYMYMLLIFKQTLTLSLHLHFGCYYIFLISIVFELRSKFEVTPQIFKMFWKKNVTFVCVSLTMGKSLLVSSIRSVCECTSTAKRGRCMFRVPGAAGVSGLATHLFPLVFLFTGRSHFTADMRFEITPYHHHHPSEVGLATPAWERVTENATHTHA